MMHIEGQFLSAHSQNDQVLKEEVQDGFYDLLDTMPDFVPYQVVLNRQVKNLKQHCDEIGLIPRGSACLMQTLLAELSGLSVVCCRIHLVAWIRHYSHCLDFLHKWCGTQGSDLGLYYDHLAAGGASDGLEVLLASIAMNTMINIVFKDSVWSSAREGLDFQFPTIVWTTAGAVACHSLDPDTGVLGDVDMSKTSESVSKDEPMPSVLWECKYGGQPLIPLNINSSEHTTTTTSDSSDMDPDAHYTQQHCQYAKKPCTSGLASPQHCMLCGVGLELQKLFVFHLRQNHPSMRPYHCVTCDKTFNNAPGLASHMTNVHCERNV